MRKYVKDGDLSSETAVSPKADASVIASENKESIEIISNDCSTCQDSIMSNNAYSTSNDIYVNIIFRYKPRPGEMMFDYEGLTASTQKLSTFLHQLYASNVYRMLFAYTQLIQHDRTRCYTSYNKHKEGNRFIDIPCLEETRVYVRHPNDNHDYIHANWVDGYREPKKFIITQTPVAYSIEQFWRMIWQEKVVVIISMTQIYDTVLPEQIVNNIPINPKHAKHVGNIMIVNCGTRNIRKTYDATILKENDISPIVVHCLTGTGRSSTLVALDICCRKLDDTVNRPCGPLADVEDVVLRLRSQRAMAIQKAEQYLFLHLSVLEYAVRQKYITDETYGEIDMEGFYYGRSGSKNTSMESVLNK
uniref:Protein-tyrosine phosphatase n=1 Tax=Heterorhabditis bacteriophora TaxID=37862 RepID=A0A1I7X907_HETBA